MDSESGPEKKKRKGLRNPRTPTLAVGALAAIASGAGDAALYATKSHLEPPKPKQAEQVKVLKTAGSFINALKREEAERRAGHERKESFFATFEHLVFDYITQGKREIDPKKIIQRLDEAITAAGQLDASPEIRKLLLERFIKERTYQQKKGPPGPRITSLDQSKQPDTKS